MCCCLVSPPRLQNLVVHFRIPSSQSSLLPLLEKIRGSSGDDEDDDGGGDDGKGGVGGKGKKKGGRKNGREKRRRRRRREGKKNFFILRRNSISYTVFPHSGNVIATGLRDRSVVQSTLDEFRRMLGGDSSSSSSSSFWPRTVVNSTYLGQIGCNSNSSGSSRRKNVSICKVLAWCKTKEEHKSDLSINFRSQFFPGARVKWNRLSGTANVFNNGKYVLVGVREDWQAEKLRNGLCALMTRYWTTTRPEKSCAQHADLC